jgi:plasmid maintenance system antidote protein VapI
LLVSDSDGDRRTAANHDDLTGQLVSRLDENEVPGEHLWPIVCYFAAHGIDRREVATRMGVTSHHLTTVMLSGKPINIPFLGRLRQLLAAPLSTPAVAAESLDRQVEFRDLFASGQATQADVGRFVEYAKGLGIKRAELAQWLAIVHSYLNSVLCGTHRLTDEFCWRLVELLANPLPPRSPANKRPRPPKAGLAMRHYVDPRQIQQHKPMPPRLLSAEGGAA